MALTKSGLFSGMRLGMFVASAVFIAFFSSFPATTTALPMKSIIGEALTRARWEEHEEVHRQKRSVTRTECVQPGGTDLHTWFAQANAGLDLTEFLQKTTNGQAISIPASAYPAWQSPDTDTSCPASVNRSANAPLQDRSLCPYFFKVLQLPEGYYPRFLKGAHCKCQICLEKTSFGCEQVFTEVTVLKPVGCFQGLQKYEEEIKEIPTSCTCAYKSSDAQARPSTTTTPSSGWGVN